MLLCEIYAIIYKWFSEKLWKCKCKKKGVMSKASHKINCVTLASNKVNRKKQSLKIIEWMNTENVNFKQINEFKVKWLNE